MDEQVIELIEKIGRLKLLVERIPDRGHSMTCPADDDTGHPCPCKCGADRFNNAVEDVKLELGIDRMSKLFKKK